MRKVVGGKIDKRNHNFKIIQKDGKIAAYVPRTNLALAVSIRIMINHKHKERVYKDRFTAEIKKHEQGIKFMESICD